PLAWLGCDGFENGPIIGFSCGRESIPQMEKSILQFCKELEDLGEDQIRARLAEQFYSNAEAEEVARALLKEKALARAAVVERSKAEREAALARAEAAAETAADGVERGAQAAAKSNEKASIAIMFGATAITISFLSLLAHLFK